MEQVYVAVTNDGLEILDGKAPEGLRQFPSFAEAFRYFEGIADIPITEERPHPQARAMREYADVATWHPRPWEEFEFSSDGGQTWNALVCHPEWADDGEYRRIGGDDE